jgi:hypothetical protein
VESEPPWALGTIHKLTEIEAFDAMTEFARAFYRRSGEPDDELLSFVASVSRSDWGTADPAHWSDWLEAIRSTLASSKTQPGVADRDEILLAAENLLERLRKTLAADPAGRRHALSWDDETLVFQLIELARSGRR